MKLGMCDTFMDAVISWASTHVETITMQLTKKKFSFFTYQLTQKCERVLREFEQEFPESN